MNILIISPFFTPIRTVGAQRMTSLAKYLLEKGEYVTVMHNTPHLYNIAIDEEIAHPNLKSISVPVSPNDTNTNGEKLYIGYLEEHLTKVNYDIIIVSCGPFYLNIIPFIKSISATPCIIDFRDLWIYESKRYATSNLLYLIRRLKLLKFSVIEKNAIDSATAIVAVSVGDKLILNKHYPYYKNIHIIYNGYEKVDIESRQPILIKGKEQITIAVAGKFYQYNKKAVKHFFVALKELIYKGLNIIVVMVGDEEQCLKPLLKKINFPEKYITFCGVLPYKKTLEILSSAHCLALTAPSSSALGTKLFDYISLKRSIIAMVKKGDAIESLLNTVPNAYACHNKNNVLSAINKIASINTTDHLTDFNVEDFSRQKQNEKYHELLYDIVGR